MKLLIASDIHGSANYAGQLIDAYEKEGAEKLILLGDLLYHGPRNDLPFEYDPKKVIEILNEKKDEIICVRGNCDADIDVMMMDFPLIPEYAAIYADGHTMYITHGHVYNEDNLIPMKKGDILIHGHTHVPKCNVCDMYTCLNPGSVSIPRGNSPHSYIKYENGTFLWKDLDGNVFMEHKI